MTSPFVLAKQHPNSFMIDHRDAGLKLQEPMFLNCKEEAVSKMKDLQKLGHLTSLYSIDENGKTTFISK